MAKKWILPKLMRAVDQKPGYNLEWPDSKTHISGQKPRGRQLNTKVSVAKVPFFFLCYDFFHGIFSNNDNSKTVQALTLILARNGCSSQCAASQPSAPSSLQIHPGQQKPFTTLLGCCPLLTTPFSNFVRMRTRSLVPRPKTTIISLEARLVHRRNGQLPVRMAGTEAGTVFPKVYAIHGFSPLWHWARLMNTT